MDVDRIRKGISGVIILTIAGFSPAYPQVQKKLSLEAIYKEYKFYSKSIANIRSMNDGNHYTTLNSGRYIEKYDYETGSFIENIFDITTIDDSPISGFSGYEFNKDESKILLTSAKEKIYRHSYVADYYIFDRKINKIIPLTSKGKSQLATFSPDGSKLAFVRKNNLFYKDLVKEKEIQITFDGEFNKIINGAPDWVYEEEFSFNKAFEWSPNSKRIAYYRFNEEGVKQFNLTQYNGLYPEWYRFKYPKAGEENSIVDIWVMDIETGIKMKMDIGREKDQYIPRIEWTMDAGTLSIMRLNRLQNYLEILHANAATGRSRVVYSEREDQYISEASDETITYLENGKEFIFISERDNYKHFYLCNFITGIIDPITSGNFDITGFLGYNEKTKTLYFTSHERSPLQQDIYSIGINGKNKKLLSSEAGWNEAVFSNNYNYFINTWSNINHPAIISLKDKKGKLIRILEDNQSLKNNMNEYGFTKTEFFSFLTSDDIELFGYMIKPADFDNSKKYPVFMYVYGGPESQKVTDAYFDRLPWFQQFAQSGYIVVCVDGRGTDGRGEAFRKATYMQLGKYETFDQTEAAKYLTGLKYVDKDRIGIFGWSYGGYMSLSCLFKSPDMFKMAISVAPVTNWRFYDTIYTERFMRTPQENPEGYDENSPINFVQGMKGKLLLIHGMEDDNVHFQNSVELTESLVDAEIQFDMQFYPNKNHNISGRNTTFHLYERMTGFVLENL